MAHRPAAEEQAVPAVVLTDLSKFFGPFAALKRVQATFAAGRIYGVFGDNGAGKSTLLRVMAGLARPTKGSVRIFGREPREALSELGYMAHASMLYDEMTARENLAYVAELHGVGPERIDEAVRIVGLDPELKRRVGQYSQGMRQRLSLARALLHDPQLLLLDEPFSNLDVHGAAAIARILAGLRDAGKTIFLVTHQSVHLDGIADESILLARGELIARKPGIEAERLMHSADEVRHG